MYGSVWYGTVWKKWVVYVVFSDIFGNGFAQMDFDVRVEALVWGLEDRDFWKSQPKFSMSEIVVKNVCVKTMNVFRDSSCLNVLRQLLGYEPCLDETEMNELVNGLIFWLSISLCCTCSHDNTKFKLERQPSTETTQMQTGDCWDWQSSSWLGTLLGLWSTGLRIFVFCLQGNCLNLWMVSSNDKPYLAGYSAYFQEFLIESLNAVPDCYFPELGGDRGVVSLGRSIKQVNAGVDDEQFGLKNVRWNARILLYFSFWASSL